MYNACVSGKLLRQGISYRSCSTLLYYYAKRILNDQNNLANHKKIS